MKGMAGIKLACNNPRRRQEKILKFSALSLAMAAIFSTPAYAADSNDGVLLQTNESAKANGSGSKSAQTDEQVMDTMTVLASKSSDPHTKTELGKLTAATPVAGSVLTREVIDELQYVDALKELSGRVPGMTIIRNMRIPDGAKNYTDERINGLRVAYNMNMSLVDQVDMATIDHIDFINGPGTAINSSYAVAGTINVVSLDPPKSFEGRVSQELGSFALNRTQVNVGNSFSNGAGLTLAASNMDYGGSRENNSDKEKKSGVGGEFLIRPTENSKLVVGVDQFTFDYRLANPITQTQFNQDWQQAGTYGRSVSTYDTYNVRYQLLLGDRSELKLAAGQRDTATTGYGNTGNGTLAANNTIAVSSEMDTTYQAIFRRDFDLAQSTLNVGAETYTANLGSVTYNNTYTTAEGQAGNWGQGTLNSKGSLSTEQDMTPFLQYEFSPQDKVRFSLGERFDRIDDAINNLATPAASISGKAFDKNVFKGGVTFDYAPEQMVWGNISQGFLAPALTALSGSGTTGNGATVATPNLLPEQDLTQEIGFRGKSTEHSLRYDVTFYHTTIQDIVVNRALTAAEVADDTYGSGYTTSSLVNENAASLTARGVETQFAWNVTQKVELASTYTWAEAYYNTYISGSGANRLNLSGKSYQNLPTDHLNLRVAYLPIPGARIELEGDYISSFYIDTLNSAKYQRPALFNLRSSYALNKNWTTTLQIHNLGNVHYADHVGDTTNGNPSTRYFNTYGNSGSYEPLSVRIGVAYKFN